MSHKDSTKLLQEIESLKSNIKVGDKYFHYKHPDQIYQIIAVGFIEATEEPCVVYRGEYGDKITWVRTENEFFSKVELKDGRVVDRFTKVS